MNFKVIDENKTAFIGISVVILFSLFWDIGNLSGIRQGTEALYLQVSKEMFEAGSFLTPLYRAEHHWSKPPLHFWLPFPLYQITGGYSLLMARASVALLSLFSLIYFAIKLHKWVKVPKLLTFFLFVGSMGVYKFSRTFMMEIPFAFLPTISMFMFWEYLQGKKISELIGAIIFLALSVLIKGPVTLVMAFGGLILYQGYIFIREKRLIVKEGLLLFLPATLLASIWFALCYLKYGNEFFDYFFLRENLGKFGQVKMSSLKIVQGVILYIFPWWYAIGAFIGYTTKNTKKFTPLVVYLSCLSLSFFFMWFIPAQKSHHYALPVLPFLLTLLVVITQEIGWKSKIIKWGQLPIVAIFIIVELLLLYFAQGPYHYMIHIINIIIWGIAAFYLWVNNGKMGIAYSALGFTVFWSFILNIFFLPVVPHFVVQKIHKDKREVVLNDRRSYFFEEAIGQRIKAVSAPQGEIFLDHDKGYLIGYHSRFTPQRVVKYKAVATWSRWLRKIHWRDLKKAIKLRDLNQLKENVYLLERKK